MYYEYFSKCCDALPFGEVDESDIKYSGPLGFCSRCKDNCEFYEDRIDEEPFDTQEEKHGER